MQKGSVEFFKGVKTPTFGVNGNFLGPSLRMRAGETVRLNVHNTIGEPATLHWHGLHVPALFDGGPHQVIEPGKIWSPEFSIKQMAGTFWYHPHTLHNTGQQVWKGIAGLMLVEDEDSDRLDMPKDYGIDDIPLVLQDRLFNRDGSFRYIEAMHNVMMGMKGDVPLTNGTITPYFKATTNRLRLRLLNGSNARLFNLGFDDDRSFYQIATDGSFLEAPYQTNRVRLGPGERAEIIVELSRNEPVVLRTYPFTGSGGIMGMMRRGMGMMRNMMGDDNRRFDFLQIRPSASLSSSPEMPARLINLPRLDASTAVKTRRFVMEMLMGPAMMMGGGNPFSINGRAMEMNRIDEIIKLGDTEIWEIHNASPLPHPFHIHDIQFQILDRNGEPPHPGERGFKDTVTVDPDETVRVIAKFEDYADPDNPYMYHCHILEHEDNGMMGQFVVKA
ncbi:MAG: oxidase [Hyphomicrobiales bacterium]|nr:MAG: oxidase [Hyphomicrobiales bacterium]